MNEEDIRCKKCGHNMIDHPHSRCLLPGCNCSLPCHKCKHPMNSHFFGFCLEDGCECWPGKHLNGKEKTI